MRSIHVTSACFVAGGIVAAALAQPVIDGTLVGDEAFYSSIRWVQNQPTSFGDNHPANVPPSGNPGDVTTGIEFAIPIAAIQGSGTIRLSGFVNSGDHTFSSNQVIGGLPNLGNLGTVSAIDYNDIDGKQHIVFTPGTSPNAPTVDGTLEPAIYGAPFFLQNNFTGFGDATHGNVDGGSGSEIDGVYAVKSGTILYVMITGNLEANNNALELFFDTVAGGQNTLNGQPGGVDNNALEAMSGLTFDALDGGGNFEADYYMTISGEDTGGGNFLLEAYLAEVGAGGDSWFLGMGGYGTDGTIFGGDGDAPPAKVTIDNSNTQGVIGMPPIDIPSPDFAVGSEIDGVYSYVDTTGDRLYLLVTGNMESNYNKLNLFFDVQPGGQNTLRGDNVDISFNGLNRMGESGNGAPPEEAPGLTFDSDFAPDYWCNFNTGGIPIAQFTDAALLRIDGPAKNLNGLPLDYGCYDGGEKAVNNPVPFDGPNIDPQDGFTPDLYSNFAPRTSYEALQDAIADDPFDPQPIKFVVAQRLISTIDNSNIAGVTGDTIAGAADVETGMELSVALSELGWDANSDIKIAGFISGAGFDFVSNQVLGGLPSPDNIGEPVVANFADIAGTQYIIAGAGGCPGDCDGNGSLNILDFVCFQQQWQQQTAFGDCDNNGLYNILDFVCFQQAFVSGCN